MKILTCFIAIVVASPWGLALAQSSKKTQEIVEIRVTKPHSDSSSQQSKPANHQKDPAIDRKDTDKKDTDKRGTDKKNIEKKSSPHRDVDRAAEILVIDGLGAILIRGSQDNVEAVKKVLTKFKSQKQQATVVRRQRADRTHATDRPPQTDRPPRADRAPRTDRAPKTDRAPRMDQVQKTERARRGEAKAPARRQWVDDQGKKHEIVGTDFYFSDHSDNKPQVRQSNKRKSSRLDLPEAVLQRLRDHDIDINRDEVEIDVQMTDDGKQKFRVRARKRLPGDSPGGDRPQTIERRVEIRRELSSHESRSDRPGRQGGLRPSREFRPPVAPRQEGSADRSDDRRPNGQRDSIEKLTVQMQRLERKIDALTRQIERLIQTQNRNRR